MPKDMRAALGKLPVLGKSAQFAPSHNCKICGHVTAHFDTVDFNKYCSIANYYEFGRAGIGIDYHRCLSCGFIFTVAFDDWSADDFARYIYNHDYVKVDGEYTHARPARTARAVAEWLRGCEAARILDYGSGAGIFAHCMRQAGFAHIESYDPFSSPARPSGAFDIVTCFEVIEHSPDPVATLADMRQFLRADGCILFGQTTQPADILARRGSWWYIAPRNGHVSTYSEESLAVLGQRQGLTLHKGADMYGYAPLYPSSFARVALAAIGPSLATVRLLAPDGLLTSGWHFPSRAETVWHQQGDDGVWRHCWTGSAHMQWQASWQPADRLQIRLPYINEVAPGFAAACRFEHAGETLPARLDRGELVAEMPTHGATSGTISLHTPAPLDPHAGQGEPPGPHGLAIPVILEPCVPAHLRAAA